jgi:hypothetical protein
MHMHPTLTLAVYILVGAVVLGVFLYMFFYGRGLKSKQAVLDQKGRMPLTREEGIAVATEQKEKAGRTGTIT